MSFEDQDRGIGELQHTAFFQAVIDALPEAVCIVDHERRVLFWNKEAERITGYLRQEAIGRPCHGESLIGFHECAGETCPKTYPLSESMHEGKVRESRLFLRHKEGHRVLVQLRVVPIRDERGHVIGAAENFEELNKESEDDYLSEFGCVDPVAGVPNQKFMYSQLLGNLAMFAVCGVPFAVLHLQLTDLDQFKASRGVEAAEMLLHVVAHSVRGFVANRGVLGRWGESDFLIVLRPGERCAVERECEEIRQIAEKSEIHWWSDWLSIRVDVVGTSAQSGDTPSTLLERLWRRSGVSDQAADTTPPVADVIRERENEAQ